MEGTFKKFSKSICGAGGAGVSELLQNFGAYQRWIKTTSERAQKQSHQIEESFRRCSSLWRARGLGISTACEVSTHRTTNQHWRKCLTPVPSCLGTPDCFMAKTNKATAVHYVTRDVTSSNMPPKHSGETLYGNAHFHTLNDVQPTFELIGLQLLDRLANKPDVIFSTDSYHEGSIKSQEKLRRGVSEKFIVEGIQQRKPADFQTFSPEWR